MSSAFERELRAAQWPQGLSDLAATGVTADMTRSRRWRRSSRGFFVPADTPFTTTQRILDASPLIPSGGAVAGWAAAYALGVDLLDGQDCVTMATLPVPIHLGRDLGRSAPSGVRFARERLAVIHRQVLHGLPVTSPLRTMFDGGRWARDLTEAVVLLDQVAHALELDLSELQAWCVPGARWPGIKQLRAALALADARSGSPWSLDCGCSTNCRLSCRGHLSTGRCSISTALSLAPPTCSTPRPVWSPSSMERSVDSLDMRQPVPLKERLRARYAHGMRRNRELDRWTMVEPPWWRRRRRAA